MLCMGKPYFEAVHEMDDDKDFYKTALFITRRIPSEETLRQRMDDIGDSLRQTILEQNLSIRLRMVKCSLQTKYSRQLLPMVLFW